MRDFLPKYAPSWKKLKCFDHHSLIRKPPYVCPWCVLRRVLTVVREIDEFRIDPNTTILKDEIENIYFDANIFPLPRVDR